MDFITEDFTGSVVLKDWYQHRDGSQVRGIIGRITILRDEQIVGFKTRGTESNWCARVVGPTESITILGCQIRAIASHPLDVDVTPGAYLRVA